MKGSRFVPLRSYLQKVSPIWPLYEPMEPPGVLSKDPKSHGCSFGASGTGRILGVRRASTQRASIQGAPKLAKDLAGLPEGSHFWACSTSMALGFEGIRFKAVGSKG